MARAIATRFSKWRPAELWRVARRLPRSRIPLRSVRFGDFRRLTPIDGNYGFGRGTPVDRYYIERFLARNAADVTGRVLEIGDNTYTSRFGENRVIRSYILHVRASDTATFVGDLSADNPLPESSFDCIIFTQTLQLIFDMRAALKSLHRALRAGGTLLLTVPGITKIDPDEWSWYWSLTPLAARRLLEESFRPDNILVESHGNVLAAISFLHGLAAEELTPNDLDQNDLSYPVTVAARATKG